MKRPMYDVGIESPIQITQKEFKRHKTVPEIFARRS